jgi:dipeptidase
MWGAEMGANERGLVIGNEAVFTRMPVNRKGGLTGMDLLRLALERASTAMQAVETIVQLLADHGQGGVCGFEDKWIVYHNSFLCADPKEAWVLDTAGQLWATRRVDGYASISNGLTIGETFDACHPDSIRTAKQKGWLKAGETFDFARCFSDRFFTTFLACRARQYRSFHLIGKEVEGGKCGFDVPSAMRVLRDHYEDGYRPDSHLFYDRLCAHASNRITRHSTQTTGSLVAHLAKNLYTCWATGTGAPCTGVFKPVWFGRHALPDMGPPPVGTFHPDALWWQHETLHRSVLLDYPTRLKAYREERDDLERTFLDSALDVPPEGRSDLTQRAFAQAREATFRWTGQVREMPIRCRANGAYRRYWRGQNRRAGIEVSG